MTTAEPTALYGSLLESVRNLGTDMPAGWTRLRAGALAALEQQGLPGRDVESFRFSALGSLLEETIHIGDPPKNGSVEGLIEGAVLLPLRGGALRLPGKVPAGLRVESLRAACERGGEAARHLGSLLSTEDGWIAANTAGFQDGYLIEVADGVKFESPLELVFVQGDVGGGTSPVAALSRVVVVLGNGASLDLLERHVSVGDGTSLNNVVVEMVVGEGATLTHTRWVDLGPKAYQLAATAVCVGSRGNYRSWSATAAGRYVRHDLQVHLRGEGASTTLDGLFYGRTEQLVDHHVRVWHEASLGTTRESYRGIIENRGRGVFDGTIYVRPGAAKTDAKQESRNLLLGPESVLNAKPHLEIDADDVSCSHGATVGRLDEEQLFYLRARGIDETLGRQLLIWAFAQEVVERCPCSAIAQLSAARLRGALPAGAFEEMTS